MSAKQEKIAKKSKLITERQEQHDERLQQLAAKEKQMMEQFAALKQNVSAMTAKQEKIMRLQEIRQR